MSGAEPYVAFVATTRNDDHGGGMLGRMQLFVDGLAAQCERHGLQAELVLVEWNPPPDRPGLAEALSWPAAGGRLTARIVEVPPELHARYAHADRLPLFQMIGKNVGIRRARAPFVVATNIDLLFSDPLMAALATRRLDRGTLYRADRHDVAADVPAGAPIEEQLAWCAGHLLRVNERRGTRDLQTGAFYPIYSGILDLPRYVWHFLDLRRGDFAGRAYRTARRRLLRRRIAARRAAEGRAYPGAPTRSAARRLGRTVKRARIRPHTNACGDFTLLAAEHWHALRGYPELELYSLHIDSLLLYMSRHAGIRERLLPGPTYHIEHSTGFRPEGASPLFTWLRTAGIPWITNERFADYVIEMATSKRPLQLNDDAWGLGGTELREQTIPL